MRRDINPLISDSFELIIDESVDAISLIENGSYGTKASRILALPTSNLSDERHILSAKLFSYHGFRNFIELSKFMASDGFRPGVLSEMLYFDQVYGDCEKNLVIISLGSCYYNRRGYLYCPILYYVDKRPCLKLISAFGSWSQDIKFLGIML
ncbi:MAG: hypothetical protein ACOYMB_05350 [Patescibacteria group bacterium]